MPRQFGELISSPGDSELYYRVSGEHHFMAASLQSDPRFRVIGQERLFEAARFWTILFRTHYDIHPDGERFLMNKESEEELPMTELIVVENWFEELKRLAPTGKD